MAKKEQFKASHYQEAIFDFIKNGQGNVVVEACPGSGKSTTLIHSLEYIPKGSKVLVTAFNTDIVKELESKIKKSNLDLDIECRTIHGLGYSLLLSNFPDKIGKTPNEFKYWEYLYTNIDELSNGESSRIGKKNYKNYLLTIKKLIDFGRYFLCQTHKQLEKVVNEYDIDCFGSEIDIALKCMDWGKREISTIDFTDMVWLPIVLHCKPYGKIYDWIMLDEAQDVEKEERELLLLCTKMSTRMCIYGEKKQSIYAWKGSDYQSFMEFLKLPNTTSLPLSISYRCPKKVVEMVHAMNPSMECLPSAIDGEIHYNLPLDKIKDGGMVLCRVNAPLVELYQKLLRMGKNVSYVGKETGNDFIKLIEKCKEEKLSSNLKLRGVIPELYNKLITKIDNVMQQRGVVYDIALNDMEVSNLYDTIQSIVLLSEGVKTKDELIAKIKKIFNGKKNKKGISLLSMHKSKGLESDDVYICCPSITPSGAVKTWQLEQEENLKYVAYTRAKKSLNFLDESDFRNFFSSGTEKGKKLKIVMQAIFVLYGGRDRCSIVHPNSTVAQAIIEKCKEVKIKPANAVNISQSATTLNSTSLLGIAPKKKKIKRNT